MAAWASLGGLRPVLPGRKPFRGGELWPPCWRGASGQVDAICFGRIRRAGIERTDGVSARERIAEAVCVTRNFRPPIRCAGIQLASYGINGVAWPLMRAHDLPGRAYRRQGGVQPADADGACAPGHL